MPDIKRRGKKKSKSGASNEEVFDFDALPEGSSNRFSGHNAAISGLMRRDDCVACAA
jgi:hypothetical protein